MKNLILLVLFLTVVACRNSFENKEKGCPQYKKGSREYYVDSLRDGLSFIMDRGNVNRAVNMSDYDTIYRYRGYGGWGEFDNICTIYRQMDTPQYKIQLLRQRTKHDTMYDVSAKTLTMNEWLYFRKKFEISNFWCYSILEDGRSTDSNLYSVTAKEKNRKRNIFWREEEHYNDTLRGLGTDMLELADYPMPYAKVYFKNIRDSIHVDVIPSDLDIHFMKKYYFKDNFKGGKMLDGVYQLTIHKKDFDKLNDIEMVIALYNGKIRTTTEKKIEKAHF